MTDPRRSWMRQLLVSSYDELLRMLTRRLRSKDAAGEVLHDTFVRIESAELQSLDNPRAYLFAAAMNAANDRLRGDLRRRLSSEEVDDLFELEIADETPGPAQLTEAQSDIDALQRALASMPARRQDIFLSSFIRAEPHVEIAQRLGVTQRTVQLELKVAVMYCATRLRRDRTAKNNFASHTPKTSLEIGADYSRSFPRKRK